MKKITLIIAALNEGKEPLNTIKSIYETANPELFDLIVINDGSKKWVDIPKKYKHTFVEHENRKGIPYCRQLGADMAKTPYIAFFNARMRFTKGWIEKALEYLDTNPKTLFCTTSVVLWDKDYKEVLEMAKKEKEPYKSDLIKHAERIKDIKNLNEISDDKERKYGCEIVEHYVKNNMIMAGHWIPEQSGKCYEIPCIMGANYFVNKKWFNYIDGLHGLYSYGAEEEFMSLKTWAFGGKVKIIKEIEIGNIYHMYKPYADDFNDYVWNYLLIAFTLLDWDKAYGLLHKVKYCEKFKKYYEPIKNRIIKEMPYIRGKRQQFKNLTVRNINDLVINLEERIRNGSK